MTPESVWPRIVRLRLHWLLLPLMLLLGVSGLLWRTASLEDDLSAGRQRGLEAVAERQAAEHQQEKLRSMQTRISDLQVESETAAVQVLEQLRSARLSGMAELQYEELEVRVPSPLRAIALQLRSEFSDMPALLDFLDRLTSQQSGTRVDACDVARSSTGEVLEASCTVRWLFREER